MWHTLRDLAAVFLILVTGFASGRIIIRVLTDLPPCGTGYSLEHCQPQPHPMSEMRWDQRYLTEQSHEPCPAVYDAPNGELRECL